MENIKRTSIRSKISFHVALLLIGTISFLTFVNLLYMSRNIVKEQEIELHLASELSAQQVDDWAQDMVTVTEDMASSLTALGSIDAETVGSVIDRVALAHPEYYYVYFADKLGNMNMARGVQFAKGVDPRQRPWYKKAEEAGHSVVIDPYTSATSPDVMMVTVATPVFWGSLLVGVVGVDAEISSIEEFMSSINFEQGAYGILLDSKSNVIYHPYDEYNPSAEKVTNAIEALPELKAVLESNDGEAISDIDYKGIEMVYSLVDLKVSGWKVIVAYPEKGVMQRVYSGIQISIAVALICLIAALLHINFIVRRVLNPIGHIKPAMEKIMQGDFTSELDFATANDEIGDLQNMLAMTIGELSDIIKEEKHVLGEMEKGNLVVEDIDQLPGELNEIAEAVNSIKATFNDMVSDIQFSAINLQSFAMGINETSDLDEMRMVFEELSAEANALMEKTDRFITAPNLDSTPYTPPNDGEEYRDDF